MHTTPEEIPIRIITHNVRYAPANPSPGEAPWSSRLPPLAAHFKYHTIHAPSTILCLQEVLHHQLCDLLATLNNPSGLLNWAYTGVGRDDGARAGEYAPILFNPQIYSLRHNYTMWLSKTPYVPGSKGWDAASVRICTIAMFRHLTSKREFVVLNTHLDDQGTVARKEAAKMLVLEAQRWTSKGLPVVLAGDLNSEVGGEAYEVLTGSGVLVDVRECVRQGEVYGERMTFTGFEGKKEELQRLDYIFVGSKVRSQQTVSADEETGPNWSPGGYAVLPNRFEDGVYQSDHRAVVADLILE